jgi:ribosomal protein L24
MAFNVGDTVAITGGKYKGNQGQVMAVESPTRYTVRVKMEGNPQASIAEKDLAKSKE